jgi:hypothetical protein
VAGLDGLWSVRRVSGALPPLWGVRKCIHGERGETTIGPIRVPFDMRGNELHYRAPFAGFVDIVELSPDGAHCDGRATFRRREFARFAMERLEEGPARGVSADAS